MDKKNKQGKNFMSALIAVEILLLLVNILLFAFSVFSIVVFVILLSIIIISLALTIWKIVNDKRKQKQKAKVEPVSTKLTDQDLIDLYNRAGIPVLYDENGKIKNIFELLKIEAQYDKTGKRILTIYELLGIVPRFDKDGNEVPTFLSIKNRVKGFVKPNQKTGNLTRVLTEQEKEDLLLKQMLKEKLQESINTGDEKKTKAIKKVIDNQKKQKEEAPRTPDRIKLASGKAVGIPKANVSKIKIGGRNIIDDVMTATAFMFGQKAFDGILHYGVNQVVNQAGKKEDGFHKLKSGEVIDSNIKYVSSTPQTRIITPPVMQGGHNSQAPVMKVGVSKLPGGTITGLKQKIQENREKSTIERQ